MATQLSPQTPWPGLRAFRETDREFFFGRERETKELVALVQRVPVTVLYARSGVGKTSLIGAGLLPELRRLDYVACRVRLDHNAETLSLDRQVKAALAAELDAQRVDGPRPASGETLWEYFHRRDLDLWARGNRLVTPVVILDQFEEIFTLGGRSEETSRRATEFVAALESVIEHRPPDDVRERLEDAPDDAIRFDFQREAVKFVVSLREDFLPQLDTWRTRMPSLLANRLRLERLTGAQALEVVERAGRDVVDVSVARDIVEFVSTQRSRVGSLEQRTVEPALLSVVCDELNRRRIERGQSRITGDLLTHEREGIIQAFYARAFEGVRQELRDWVENELLTSSGYRDQAAQEDALRLGLLLEDVDRLVDRRILQREERGGVIWLELTHDLLSDPAAKSRSEREARLLAEESTRREALIAGELRRTRRLAATFGVLLLAMAGAVFFAYMKWGEAAREADRANGSEVQAKRSQSAAQVSAASEAQAAELARVEAARAAESFRSASLTVEELDARLLELIRGNVGASTETILAIVAATEDAYARLVSQDPDSEDLIRQNAAFMARAADVLYLVGHVDEGLAFGANAVAHVHRGADAEAPPKHRLATAHSHLSYGKGLLAVGRLGESREQLQAVLAQARTLLKTDLDEQARELFVGARLTLGRLENARAARSEAAGQFKAVLSFLPTGGEEGDADVKAWRVEALIGLASSEADRTDELKWYSEADRLVRFLRRSDPDNPRWRRLGAELSYQRGFTLLKLGQLDSAERDLSESASDGRFLTQLDAQNRDWQYMSVLSQRGLTELLIARKAWQRADERARDAMSALKKLRDEEKSWIGPTYLDGALLWFKGQICRGFVEEVRAAPAVVRHWQPCEAMQPGAPLQAFKDAHAVMQAAAKRVPEHAEFRRAVAITLGSQGYVLTDQGKHQDAIRLFSQAIAQLEASPRLARSTEYLENKAPYHTSIGDALLKLNRRREANESHQKAVTILSAVISRTPTPPRYASLSSAHLSLGDALRGPKSEGFEAALREYAEAERAVRSALVTVPDDPSNLRLLALIQGRRADVWLDRGQMPKAVDALVTTLDTLWPPLCANASNALLNGDLTYYRKRATEMMAALKSNGGDSEALRQNLETVVNRTEVGNVVDCGRRPAMSLAPLIPGTWRTLLEAEQKAKIAAWKLDDARLRLDQAIVMRRRQLMFYNNAALYEIEVQLSKARRGIVSVVERGTEVVRLDGTSPPIHAMNATAAPALDSVEQATAYLQFFMGALSGDEGRFMLVDRASELHWGDKATPESKDEAVKGIGPLTVWQDFTGQWQAVGTLQYGTALFRTTLLLDRSGSVRMMGERPVVENLDTRLERYLDGARVLETPDERRLAILLGQRKKRLEIDKNDLKSLESIAQLYNGLKQRKDAVAAQERLIAARRSTTKPEERKQQLAPSYLTLAWYQLLARDFAGALKSCEEGSKLDPSYLAMDTNRAHALLFLGRTAEAEALYREHVGKSMKPLSDRSWEREILNDFDVLESEGLVHPEWARLRKVLGGTQNP